MENIMLEVIGQRHTEQFELFENIHVEVNKNSKVCPKCNILKPLEHFPWKSGQQIFRRENCRACENYLNKIRNELRNKHGMPSEDYSCPLCGGSVETLTKAGGERAGYWALDHCHKTEKFRGWLCHLCNRALGCFKDNPETLKKAIDYLNRELV